MTPLKYRRAAAGACALAMLVVLDPEASAKIRCRDGFQLNRDADISTPYCNDEHLAELARARGARVTGAELRGNPNRKEEICAFLGAVGPASSYCNQPDGGASGE